MKTYHVAGKWLVDGINWRNSFEEAAQMALDYVDKWRDKKSDSSDYKTCMILKDEVFVFGLYFHDERYLTLQFEEICHIKIK
jgi:hypothetical protein